MLRNVVLLVSLAYLLAGGVKAAYAAESAVDLPDLSPADQVKLRAVPNSLALATSVRVNLASPQLAPPIAASECAANWTRKVYAVQVAMPITQCSVDLPVLTQARVTKSALRSLSNVLIQNKSRFQAHLPLVCVTSDGPWAGNLIVERGCIGTCSPLNSLTVLGVPNLIQFNWYGSYLNHPAGFEIIGRPQLIDAVDFGPCNGGNPPPTL